MRPPLYTFSRLWYKVYIIHLYRSCRHLCRCIPLKVQTNTLSHSQIIQVSVICIPAHALSLFYVSPPTNTSVAKEKKIQHIYHQKSSLKNNSPIPSTILFLTAYKLYLLLFSISLFLSLSLHIPTQTPSKHTKIHFFLSNSSFLCIIYVYVESDVTLLRVFIYILFIYV